MYSIVATKSSITMGGPTQAWSFRSRHRRCGGLRTGDRGGHTSRSATAGLLPRMRWILVPLEIHVLHGDTLSLIFSEILRCLRAATLPGSDSAPCDTSPSATTGLLPRMRWILVPLEIHVPHGDTHSLIFPEILRCLWAATMPGSDSVPCDKCPDFTVKHTWYPLSLTSRGLFHAQKWLMWSLLTPLHVKYAAYINFI